MWLIWQKHYAIKQIVQLITPPDQYINSVIGYFLTTEDIQAWTLDAMAKDQHDYTDYYEKQEALMPFAFANSKNTATRHDSFVMKHAVTK